jgi:hypothetical protein
MPARLTGAPPGIACVFSDGTSAQFILDGLPCPQLARDLLAGLAELVHPHGSIDAASTAGKYQRAARDMVTVLAGRGFTGGAADLRRPQVAEYWMGAAVEREASTRAMLRAFGVAGGVLDPAVAELAAGRAYNPQPFRRALPPYGEDEWARLTEACRRVTAGAYRAHKAAIAASARGRDPGDAGPAAANLCWLLARTGPSRTEDVAARVGVPAGTVRAGVLRAGCELFPHLDVTIAYVLLFGIYSGIVPDGIGDLLVSGVEWAGDHSIMLSYVKGRTAAESLNLPRRAVRLLEQWLDHSRLLRGFLPSGQNEQLWIGLSRPGHVTVAAGPVDRNVVRPWLARHGVLDADGRPLRLHRSRIRTTHLAMRDKSIWRGSSRATADPNHGPQVEGDRYLTATTPLQRQAVDSIVADAQHDLLRRAHPPAVLAAEDAASLAREYPRLLASLDLDDEVIAELAGGQRDVFTAACADQLSGLHGPKGKPCPARPWVCLLCPLAVFAPRHAPNLLRLKEFFSRQWQAMPAAQFMTVFGPYAQRVADVLDRYDPAVLAAAAGQVAGSDDELPLRPEELTR